MTDSTIIGRCKVADLKDGEIRKCQVEHGHVIAIYRQDGQLFATQDRCSHALASLAEGWLEGYDVYCPVHEARFDIRTGKPLCFPATDPIKTYDITTDDASGDALVREKLQ